MQKIVSSASKIVFILMALAACVFTAAGIVTGEQFLILANGAFVYYFNYQGDKKDGLGK